MSPTAQADHDARHREKDEEKLRRDLLKHRALLLDTQRMNQSIQRCLLWSEALVKGGKKALEHNVHSTDLRLGGRVLSDDGHPEDVDDSLLHSDGETRDDEMEHDGEAAGEEIAGDYTPLETPNDLESIEPFLGLSPWGISRGNSHYPTDLDTSDNGKSAERDSGVGVDDTDGTVGIPGVEKTNPFEAEYLRPGPPLSVNTIS